MRLLMLIPLLALLGSCSMLPVSVQQVLPTTGRDYGRAIPPGAGLPPRAGHLQDSLRSRLEWLAPRLSENTPYIERLAFEPNGDSIALGVQLTDANGWNSHLHSRTELACLEWGRWKTRLETHVRSDVTEAGLADWPVRLRIAYRFHDSQRGRADWRWDTLRVRLGDTTFCRPTR